MVYQNCFTAVKKMKQLNPDYSCTYDPVTSYTATNLRLLMRKKKLEIVPITNSRALLIPIKESRSKTIKLPWMKASYCCCDSECPDLNKMKSNEFTAF